MEMATVKSEAVNMGRRRLSMVDGESPEIKCNKRRRRQHTGPAIGCDGQQGDQQKHQVGDPKTATCTTTVKRSSKFRGVSRHRWTGRYEAHLWDKASWNVTQKKKGKQVYLGAYDEEESAARAYDLAALKYWGPATFTNFPVYDYETEIEIMQNVSKEEYLASLRRKSSGFSRGVSKYRGVARHHHNGRWEARIGRVFGNKYLYLGTYGTQEEAAHAYDIAAIEYRGVNAVTNFDLSTYIKWLRPAGDPVHSGHDTQDIMASQEFPSSSNIIPKGEHKQLFQNSPFTTDAIDFPQRTQLSQGKSPAGSSCTPTSSTTALSLLFRSSIFKDLLEKNSSASEDETVCEDTRQPALINSDEEYRDIFYAGSTDTQYVGSASDLNIQLGDGESSFYGQTRHTPWNLNDPL